MEKNRDLFKEAIADAKAVKEVSIANAKAALEEVITPRLKSMFEKKLTEMEEEDEKQEEGYKMKKENSELEEEFNLEELLAELDEVEDEEIHEEELTEETVSESEEAIEEETIEEELTEEEDAEETEDESEEEEEEESKVDDMDVEIDFDNMTEEDLRAFIEEVVDEMIEAEELKLTDMEDDSEEVEMDDEAEMGDEEIEIEDEIADLQLEEGQITEMTTPELIAALPSIIGGMTALIGGSIGAGVWLTNAEEGKYGDKWKAFAEKLSGAGGAAKSVKEDLKTIETLNQELTEVNLLNSKLLYLNKILKESNLKESQKVKAITAFDKAETVKEVKLVFETVSKNVVAKPVAIKEHKSFASSAAGTAATAGKKEIISEVSEQVARWQKLAGIIK